MAGELADAAVAVLLWGFPVEVALLVQAAPARLPLPPSRPAPWVSEISKNYIFCDLLNSTNLLDFFVPENLPKSAPKNGPKFHVLFVS